MSQFTKDLEEEYGNNGVPMGLYPTGYALVDPEDWESATTNHWILQKDHRGFYASKKVIRKGRTVYVRLHRQVTNCTSEQQVYFKNGNGLDCRKCNLAVWTYEENLKFTREQGLDPREK